MPVRQFCRVYAVRAATFIALPSLIFLRVFVILPPPPFHTCSHFGSVCSLEEEDKSVWVREGACVLVRARERGRQTFVFVSMCVKAGIIANI